tara:strand:- start:1358 stop:2479 length:1122 start_codon:yes stop_codon:yes gene_type:complete
MAKQRGRPRKVTDGVVENIELSEIESEISEPKIDNKEPEEVEIDTNDTHTADYPIKSDSSVIGEGTFNDFNPFAETVVERDYSTPKVASGIVDEISEPTFVPPSYEDIVNNQEQETKFSDNPFENPNPALNDLDDKSKRIAAKGMVDTFLGAYKGIHVVARKVAKVSDETLQEKQAQGKFNLSDTIPVDAKGNTLTIGEYFKESNKQIDVALAYDPEFDAKITPPLMRICMKKGWGITDEQQVGLHLAQDVLTKGLACIQIVKNQNDLMVALEKSHKQKQRTNFDPSIFTKEDIDPEPTKTDDPISDFEKEIKVEETVEDLTNETLEIKSEEVTDNFTTSLEINMPKKTPKDGGISKHPKEIRTQINKANGKK